MAKGSSKRSGDAKTGTGKKKAKSKAAKHRRAAKADRTERTAPEPDAGLAGDSWADTYETPAGATDPLQVAALHAIAAAKAFLDVAERAVQDPRLVGHALVAVRTVGKGMLGSLSGLAGSSEGESHDDPPLEHIELS